MSASVQLKITPSEVRFDEPVNIRVSRCVPNQTVTVRSRMGEGWTAHATFEADAAGMIDLASQKPVAGTYHDADPMGLIWSMTAPNMDEVQLSQLWGTSLDPVIVSFTVEIDGRKAAHADLKRYFVAPGVTRTVVRDSGLFGTFFLPAGPGPHPAVILVSGSGGGLNENRAALFAAHGYAALALAYFNYESLPKGLVEIPLEYFETAVRWLEAHPRVDRARLAISGSSRGGELSLLLGATFPQFRAVLAFVPSGLIWSAVGGGDDTPRAAWTYKGKPLPYTTNKGNPEVDALYEEIERKGEPVPLTPGFLASVADPADREAAAIPVENTNGAILLVSGDDDQMWPGTQFSQWVMERLDRCSFAHPYQHLSYPGAGHLILNPYVPTTVAYSRHPVVPRTFSYGGNPKGQAYANVDSWARLFRFLDENL